MSPFRFIRWIAEGEPVRIFGDGSQSRDYTYVDDIARGTIAALRPLGYATINLGSDAPVSLFEMARSVEQIVGREASYEKRPAADADVKATWADISEGRRLLGWEPGTALREGLERTWRWYEANREWARAIALEDRSERGQS